MTPRSRFRGGDIVKGSEVPSNDERELMDTHNQQLPVNESLPSQLRTGPLMSHALDDASSKVSGAIRQISEVHEEAKRFGSLYLRSTWQRIAEERPDLLAAVERAEAAERKAANQIGDRVSQVRNEANTVALKLDGADMSTAVDIAPLIEAELSAMSLAEMQDQLRLALVSEDKPRLYLLIRMLPNKLEAAKEKLAKGEDGMPVPSSDRDRIAAINVLLSEARKQFRDKSLVPLATRGKAIADAQAKARRLAELRKFALARKLWELSPTGDVSWIEGDSREDPQHGMTAAALIRRPESK